MEKIFEIKIDLRNTLYLILFIFGLGVYVYGLTMIRNDFWMGMLLVVSGGYNLYRIPEVIYLSKQRKKNMPKTKTYQEELEEVIKNDEYKT